MDIDPNLVTDEIKRQVESVRVIPDPPEDFEAFWRRTVDELFDIPLNLTVERFERSAANNSGSGSHDEIWLGIWRADSFGGRRIAGPLAVPSSPSGAQWVYGHGYGSVEHGSGWRPDLARLGFIAVGLDARGYRRSRLEGDPDVPGWAVHGIEDRDRYILRGAVADTIRAVQVARALEEADPERTVLYGGSFSGGTAVLAAPWIENLRYVAVSVPTFGAYDLRRALVKQGSGAEINALFDTLNEKERESLRDRLRYFNSVNAATFIRSVPVTVGLGVSDVVVPGETVAAIYHALGTPDKELFSYPCSHSDHPLTKKWQHFERHVRKRAQVLCA